MGGFGSGRQGGKKTTNDMWALDVRKVAKGGWLTPGRSFVWKWLRNGETAAQINICSGFDRVTLDYQARHRSGEWEAMKYQVSVSWTACTYGGRRAWWVCPALGCGRRVAILYGGKVYACRHCHQLAYKSQREQDYDRAGSKAEKLRDKLGWEPGILNCNGYKPKGMHQRTFEMLEAQHDALVNRSIAGLFLKFPDIRDLMG